MREEKKEIEEDIKRIKISEIIKDPTNKTREVDMKMSSNSKSKKKRNIKKNYSMVDNNKDQLFITQESHILKHLRQRINKIK
jgi:hypothetical protein